MVQILLSRLRLHDPDGVDDFLDDQQVSPTYQLRVRTSEPVETVASLIGARAWQFLLEDIMLGPGPLRELLMKVLRKAVDFKSARDWVDYVLREIINLIYGHAVLETSD